MSSNGDDAPGDESDPDGSDAVGDQADERSEAKSAANLLGGDGRFRNLLIGQSISALGDWLGTLALIALVFRITGSEIAVGGVLILRILPSLIGGPLGGLIGDRFDRRRVLVSTDLIRAGVVLLIPIGLGLWFDFGIWWVFLWAFVMEIFTLIFIPTRDAVVPDLVDDRDLSLANGLLLGLTYGSIPIAGAMFAGVERLASVVPPPWDMPPETWSLVADAITFAVSAMFIVGIRGIGGPRRLHRRDDEEDENIVLEALAGVRYAWSERPTRFTLLVASFGSIGAGVLFALGIAYVREDLGSGDVVFGFLMALFGLGVAAGIVILRVFGGPMIVWLRTGVLLAGSVLIAMGLFPIVVLALPAAAGVGAGFALAFQSGLTIMQRRTAPHLRTRALAAMNVLVRLGLVVSGGLSAVIAGVIPAWTIVVRLDPRQLLFVGAGAVILLPVLLPLSNGDEPPTEVAVDES